MAVRYPVVPNNITVHLGAPDAAARDITVSFTDYISNVAASELYPTWPRNALIANIYTIIGYRYKDSIDLRTAAYPADT